MKVLLAVGALLEARMFPKRAQVFVLKFPVQTSKLRKNWAYQLPISTNPPATVLRDAAVAPIDQPADPVRGHVGGQRGDPAAAVLADDQQRHFFTAGEDKGDGGGYRWDVSGLDRLLTTTSAVPLGIRHTANRTAVSNVVASGLGVIAL